MGNRESIVYPEIRASTQLVSSFIQKRSSLHYQINQLKLAQNTKKTCIETKKLRDLKVKNSNLVLEIKNSEKILLKIKKKTFIKAADKDLSSYVSHFLGLLYRKNNYLSSITEELLESTQSFEGRNAYYNERKNYLLHLSQKQINISSKVKRNSLIFPTYNSIVREVEELKAKLEIQQAKKNEIVAKHAGLANRRRLKRRQTFVIPKLPQNAFILRSKLLLKTDLIKQLNELRADQVLHFDQQIKMKADMDLMNVQDKDMVKLVRLNTNRENLEIRIIRYKSELEQFQCSPRLQPNSPMPPSPLLALNEVDDSLDTDFDCTSESNID